MIICRYEDLGKYMPLLKCLDSALECVEQLRKRQIPSGCYDYEGGFLFVQRGETKEYEKNKFEAHRKYIDVQYMIEGGEEVVYSPLQHLKSIVPYNENHDIEFFESKEGQPVFININSGMCYVAFPEDGHMPCRYKEFRQSYVKIVMKLPV